MKGKYLKAALAGMIVSASFFMQTACAGVIENPMTFDWSATCYDCASSVGSTPDAIEWTEVSGSITLDGYEIGTVFDMNNFVSFAYSGVSDHLPMFTIGSDNNYDYGVYNVLGTLYADSSLHLTLTAANTIPLRPKPEYPSLDLISEDPNRLFYFKFTWASLLTANTKLKECIEARALGGISCAGRHRIAEWTAFEYQKAVDALEEDRVRVNMHNNQVSEALAQYDIDVQLWQEERTEYLETMTLDIARDGKWFFTSSGFNLLDFGFDLNIQKTL